MYKQPPNSKLKKIFINAFTSNDHITSQALADCSGLSQSRVAKGLNNVKGSNCRWPSMHMMWMLYYMIKNSNGNMTEDLQEIIDGFTHNSIAFKDMNYQSTPTRSFIYKGKKMNITNIAKASGLSRVTVYSRIKLNKLGDGDNVTSTMK